MSKSEKLKAEKKKNTGLAEGIIATLMQSSSVSEELSGTSTDTSVVKVLMFFENILVQMGLKNVFFIVQPLKKKTTRVTGELKVNNSNKLGTSAKITPSSSKTIAITSNSSSVSSSISTFDIFSGIIEPSVSERRNLRIVNKVN